VNFAPMPDPHKQIADQLAAQIDQFFAAGGTIVEVEQGASADAPVLGTTTHSEKLKDRRAKRAPAVRKLAKRGMSARDIGKKLGVDTRTIALTAKEHGITFTTAT